MRLSDVLKTMPLGLPLAVTSLGTLVSLLGGKRLHAGFGIAWAILSLWHGLQHRRKMQLDAKRLCPLSCVPAGNALTLERLLSTVRVASFLEGRIRCYSPLFVERPALQKQIEEYLRAIAGVTVAKINPLTGSLLVEYRPEQLPTDLLSRWLSAGKR